MDRMFQALVSAYLAGMISGCLLVTAALWLFC